MRYWILQTPAGSYGVVDHITLKRTTFQSSLLNACSSPFGLNITSSTLRTLVMKGKILLESETFPSLPYLKINYPELLL